MNEKDDIIHSSLRIAKEWDLKGNANWSSRNYSTALLGMLSNAVTSCDNAAAGIAKLEALGAMECVRNALRSFQSLRSEIAAGKLPWAVIGGNYHLVVFSHLGTLLGDAAAAAEFLALANEREVVRFGTKFWGAYGQALLRLSRRQEIEMPQLKLRPGLEQYWIKYVQLMAVLVRGESVAECMQDLAVALESRNRERMIKDDQYEIEGSGLHPVRWDFRRDAIALVAK